MCLHRPAVQHGLFYTTFGYSRSRFFPFTIGAASLTTVRATTTNTGARAGDEVGQRYLRDMLASVARPVMMLCGFTRVHLAPGESKEIAYTPGSDALQLLDDRMRRAVEPGRFRVLVGTSSKDIRLRGDLIVR